MDHPSTRRENEVWQACDDLWGLYASVEKLTGDAIREQLVQLGYKKGSPNEIYKFRRTWKASRGIQDSELAMESSQPSNDPISRAVALVYEQIKTESRERLEKSQHDFQEKLGKIQQEYDELKERHEKMLLQHQVLNHQFLEQQQQCTLLQKQLNQEQNEHALTLKQHEASVHLFEQYKADFNLLLSELKSVQEKEVDFWREKAQKVLSEKEQTVLQLQNTHKEQWQAFSEEANQFRVSLRQMSDKNELNLKNYAIQQEKYEQLRKELNVAAQKMNQQKQELEQATKQLRSLEIKYATVRGELNVSNKRSHEYKGLWQKIQRDLMHLQRNQEKRDGTPKENPAINAD